jgi:sugar lactone lactonase YvrE
MHAPFVPESRSIVSVRSSAVACAIALGCGCGPGPLPAENPKTAPSERAPVAPVIQHSSAPSAAPSVPAAPPPPKTLVVKFANVGLATPESVLWDEKSDTYFVSNINGSPFGVDDNGFIAQLNPDGGVKALKFVDGASKDVTLNAPKGLAIFGRTLYVSDITFVRSFDLDTGKPGKSVEVKGASFLNDVAVTATGEVLVTDTGVKEGFAPAGTDAVYRIDAKGKAHPVAKDPTLSGPNGIASTTDGTYVVTFGSDKLLFLGKDGKVAQQVTLPMGSLDGLLVRPDGGFLVSSWKASVVYAGSADLSKPDFKPVILDVPSPADIGFDAKRSLVLVPLFKGDAVEAHRL